MKRIFLVVMLVLALLALNPKGLVDPSGLARVRAQSVGSAASLETAYDLTWYTIDTGGGTNNNGGYTLAGTIGQPDAAIWSGGGFTLIGGFWFSAVAEQRLYLPLILKSD